MGASREATVVFLQWLILRPDNAPRVPARSKASSAVGSASQSKATFTAATNDVGKGSKAVLLVASHTSPLRARSGNGDPSSIMLNDVTVVREKVFL